MPNINVIAAYLRSRLNNEEGATAVEYGLLVTFIAIVIIVGVSAFGTHLSDVFTNLTKKF
ncbi:Flp family type IVb pilin [Actinoplanes sp. NPDC026619]|uniref:Flp family type IVb pilin n=1 Tax=Actinoplanes sp. NPDC026619 TaxID=3155798 RepID=UPI00340979CA